MNIGIIGCGVVGTATAKGLSKAHNMFLYDKYKDEYNCDFDLMVSNCSVIFITVPTPMRISGEIDLSTIKTTVDDLAFHCNKDQTKNENPIIVIRSTAVSGTTEKLAKKYNMFHFAFNPEFLRDVSADDDFINSERIVIGTDNDFVFNVLNRVYTEAKAKWPVDPPILKTSIRTAEIIKYASNVMLASQVVVANEIYKICELFSVNYKEVTEVLSYDERIGTHIQVPGPDGDMGMGGKCFPKDINALIYLAKEQGHHSYLLEEIWRTNLRYRKNIDWI